MYTSSYRNTSWGYRHHGSPFMLIAGILVVAAIFKSGLWLPLLGLGFLAFMFVRMNGGWGHGPLHHGGHGPFHHGGHGPFQRGGHHGPWQHGEGDEKPKRSFGPMNGRPWYGQFEPDAEKPKRDQRNDDEYV